jgi:hypothetical protein
MEHPQRALINQQTAPQSGQAELYKAAFDKILASYRKPDQDYILANLGKDSGSYIDSFIKKVILEGQETFDKQKKL